MHFIHRLSMASLLCLLLSSPLEAQSRNVSLEVRRQGNAFGVMGPAGFIAAPQYDWVGFIYNDDRSIVVMKGGLYGLLDRFGKVIAPTEFDHIDACEGRYTLFQKRGLTGLFDCDERRVALEATWAHLDLPAGNGAMAAVRPGLPAYGVIDMSGREILPFNEAMLSLTQTGIIRRYDNNRRVFHWLTSTGGPLFDTDRSFTETPTGNLILTERRRKGVASPTGQILLPIEYREVSCDSQHCTAWRSLESDEDYDRFEWLDARTLKPVPRSATSQLNFNDAGLAVFKENAYFGLKNRSGSVVLPAQFDIKDDEQTFQFGSNHVAATRNGRWGLFDHSGRQILPVEYVLPDCSPRKLSPFSGFGKEPVAIAKSCENGRTKGVIDERGEWLLPPGTYDDMFLVTNVGENELWAKPRWWITVKKGNVWGVYDLTERREVVPPRFNVANTDLWNPHSIRVRVREDGPFGVFRLSDQRVFDSSELSNVVWDHDLGVFEVEDHDEMNGLLDREFRPITSREFVSLGVRNPGMFLADRERGLFWARKGNNTGVIDARGKVIVPFIYDRMVSPDDPYRGPGIFFEGAISLPRSGSLELLDVTGRVLARARDFGNIKPITLARRQDGPLTMLVATYERPNGGKHERFLLNGTLYEAAGGDLGPNEITARFSEGLMAVRVNGKFGYINRYGKMLIEPRFQHAGQFSGGSAAVHVDGQFRLINRSGEVQPFVTMRLAFATNSRQPE